MYETSLGCGVPHMRFPVYSFVLIADILIITFICLFGVHCIGLTLSPVRAGFATKLLSFIRCLVCVRASIRN